MIYSIIHKWLLVREITTLLSRFYDLYTSLSLVIHFTSESNDKSVSASSVSLAQSLIILFIRE